MVSPCMVSPCMGPGWEPSTAPGADITPDYLNGLPPRRILVGHKYWVVQPMVNARDHGIEDDGEHRHLAIANN